MRWAGNEWSRGSGGGTHGRGERGRRQDGNKIKQRCGGGLQYPQAACAAGSDMDGRSWEVREYRPLARRQRARESFKLPEREWKPFQPLPASTGLCSAESGLRVGEACAGHMMLRDPLLIDNAPPPPSPVSSPLR